LKYSKARRTCECESTYEKQNSLTKSWEKLNDHVHTVHGDTQNEQYMQSRNAQETVPYSVYTELTV